jgi:peptide deformylase
MEIVTYGNEALRDKTEPVRVIDAAAARLARDMLETMLVGKGIGLAAPQVGILKRLFVVQITDDIPRIFFNPRIVEYSRETVKFEEGCMSLPGIYADVVRPEAVRVHAWNEKGKAFTLDAEGLLARVIQHELDHLHGVMFIDHLSDLKRRRILKVWEEKARACGAAL